VAKNRAQTEGPDCGPAEARESDTVTCRIGVGFFSAHALSPHGLPRQAKLAFYQAQILTWTSLSRV